VEILSGLVSRIEGRDRVESLAVRDGGGRTLHLPVAAVFVLIGAEASPWARRALDAGVFLAGDARGSVERQVTVAAGDGMAAAVRALRWLQERP
jgi:thioredoxin reductase